MRVAVLGAGFAGLAAALDLIERGHAVTLYERRPYAGGRVYSFVDRETGHEVDNGQHIFLDCCHVLLGYIRKLGLTERFRRQSRAEILFIDVRRGGRRWLFEEAHPLLSLLRFRNLGWLDRWRLAKIVRRAAEIDPWADPALERITFAEWLRGFGLSDTAIREFWDPFVLAAINESCFDAAAAPCVFMTVEAFAKGLQASRVGYPIVGQSVFANAAVERLRSCGAAVEFGRRATRLRIEGSELRAIDFDDGRPAEADAFVVAVPHRGFWELLPDEWRRHEFFAPIERIGTSPIVSVNLWYDRPAGDFDFAAVLGSRIPWIFNRSRVSGLPGCALTIPLSAARREMQGPQEAVARDFDAAARELLPELRDAILTRSLVVREPHATISWTPGANALRRPHLTPVRNLYLAGDWTDTRWPSTMEGALRSGLAAARAITIPGAPPLRA